MPWLQGKAVGAAWGGISPGNKITCMGCGAKIEFTGDDPAADVKQLDDALEKLNRMR